MVGAGPVRPDDGGRALGQIVQVHCEEGELIDGLVDQALHAGSKGPRVFADTRPPEAESSAVARTLATAAVTGASCYLTHLSCAFSISQVRLARHAKTARLRAEVCLHHLLLDSTRYELKDAERYLVAPPLRSPEDCEQLWEALADGTIDTLGSDHSQTRSETVAEISLSGHGYSYGLAGIGARLPLGLSRGLARGLSIERLVHLLSTGPALAFGLHPRKGLLAPGSDADIVIWDPGPTTTLGTYSFDDGTGDSVYDGEPLVGQVRDVLVGGEQVVRDGRYLGAAARCLCSGLALRPVSPMSAKGARNARVQALPLRRDVVVIGGGIVGLASAFELARRGASVLVIEQDRAGSKQSGRNLGFVRQQGRAFPELAIMMEANRRWRSLSAELGKDVEWVMGGNLRLTNDPELAASYESWVKVAASLGLDSRVVSDHEIASILGAPGEVAPRDLHRERRARRPAGRGLVRIRGPLARRRGRRGDSGRGHFERWWACDRSGHPHRRGHRRRRRARCGGWELQVGGTPRLAAPAATRAPERSAHYAGREAY